MYRYIVGLPIWGLLLLATPLQAFAFKHECDLIPADFILADEQSVRDMKLPFEVMAASPSLNLLDRSGKVTTQCSSSVTSESGHIFTAGHCIESCLEKAGVYSKVDGVSMVDKQKIQNVECTINLGGERMAVRVLATNDCIHKERYAEGLTPRACKGLDYAVLERIEKPKNPTLCLKVAQTRVAAVGASVISSGYPIASSRQLLRQAARDSNGVALHFSPGVVIEPRDNCLKTLDETEDERSAPVKFPARFHFERVREWIRSGALVQTEVDTLPRSSGGGLIDAQTGELVGINSLIPMQDTMVECKGSSFFATTAMTVSQIKTDFPNVDLTKVFSCPKASGKTAVREIPL